MNELIDRQALLDECLNHYEVGNIEQNCTMDWICKTVRNFPAASPWHRVKDELPPPNKTVLVCKIWGDVNGEPHKVITMDSFTISPSDSVIAWMPLPEPPKEDA